MEMSRLIEALSEPSGYPYAVTNVEVRHTHISVVFLAGRFVYKLKKPVSFGFLDFSTLERRRHFCEEEVRLNRRLAPGVYLGVAPVTVSGPKVRFEGPGEIVEWAVKMERLPDEATLLRRLQRGDVGPDLVQTLARRIAAFHAAAEAGERISAFAHLDVVAQNARENFQQAAPHVGTALSRALFDRLQAVTEQMLVCLQPVIEERARRGVPRDTHGDLHLDHVYLFPERAAPADLVIIDCIEFNERFRFADPVADMAFLVMDLVFHGRRDLAQAFAEAYFQASHDHEGRALLPFYSAYRAAVRGKVEGFEVVEKEVPESERVAALSRARAHWLLALGELEEPKHKPCLVLVGGLPGTGKSTLACALAEQANFSVIRSDLVRKELANSATGIQRGLGFEDGIYAPEWTARTYAECLRGAKNLLFEGQRVLVDATFRDEAGRRSFLEAAGRWAVPAVFFHCQAAPEKVRLRLSNRTSDASDADWSIYQETAQHWDEPSPLTRQATREISTDGTLDQAVSGAVAMLRELALCD